MDLATVKPALEAAVLLCVSNTTEVVWAKGAQKFGPTQVTLRMRAVREQVPDEDASSYDTGTELIVPTVRVRKLFDLEVIVESASNEEETDALQVIEDIRTRLQWEPPTELLKVAGVALLDTSAATIPIPFRDDHMWSAHMLTLGMAATNCVTSTNETQWIETTQITGTVTP